MSVANPVQSVQGTGVFSIAGSASRTFYVVGERRQFVVANLESIGSGDVLHIQGADKVTAFVVFPQTSITFRTNSEFTVYNPNASVGDAIQTVIGTLFGDEYGGDVRILDKAKR